MIFKNIYYIIIMDKINKKDIFKLFIEQYFQLLNFIKKYTNNNLDFKKFYAKNYLLKKTNIKLFIKTWYENITNNYYKYIMEGNINYFLNKNDYHNESNILNKEYNFNQYIGYFKTMYNNVEKQISNTFIDYIQKLTKLSFLYYK